jgi:hypothetical protein
MTKLMLAIRCFTDATEMTEAHGETGQLYYASDLLCNFFIVLLVEAETCCILDIKSLQSITGTLFPFFSLSVYHNGVSHIND